MPRYTTKTGAGCAHIHSEPGRVIFNGAALLPHEAAMLADALNDCAGVAERQAELTRYAVKYANKGAELPALGA